jgi:hypothetical protein
MIQAGYDFNKFKDLVNEWSDEDIEIPSEDDRSFTDEKDFCKKNDHQKGARKS